jgi:hypothetical protein
MKAVLKGTQRKALGCAHAGAEGGEGVFDCGWERRVIGLC